MLSSIEERSPPPGFVLHHESTTSILFAIPKASTSAHTEAAPVFLNPVQEYNRDLSIVAIRMWSEVRAEEIRVKIEATKARREKNQGQKRAREVEKMNADSESTEFENEGEKRVKTDQSEMKDSEDVEVSLTSSFQTIPSAERVHSQVLIEVPEVDRVPIVARAEPMPNYDFTVLEALSATGLRAIRYAKEIPLLR
jgi:tRNA (guanine26-N2/guanine27-N2)-dimethyltransferase